MEPVKSFILIVPSILTVALKRSFLSVNTAPGGIIPCSTNSPKGTFGNSFLLFAIVTTSSFNTLVFFNRSFESVT